MAIPLPPPRVAPATRAILLWSALFAACLRACAISNHRRTGYQDWETLTHANTSRFCRASSFSCCIASGSLTLLWSGTPPATCTAKTWTYTAIHKFPTATGPTPWEIGSWTLPEISVSGTLGDGSSVSPLVFDNAGHLYGCAVTPPTDLCLNSCASPTAPGSRPSLTHFHGTISVPARTPI